jgi:hypothetical protein
MKDLALVVVLVLDLDNRTEKYLPIVTQEII